VDIAIAGCPAKGDPTGDTLTDALKDRVDEPANIHPVGFNAIAQLSYPAHQPRSRLQWPPPALAAIQRYEGVAVRITGFLIGLRVETGGEKTNCGATDSVAVDWHMWLTAHPQDGKARAIVVETTPRVRVHHPSWTPPSVLTFIGKADSIRISGWLMFDPDHPEQVQKTRTTLWEIHPVTMIEVFQGNRWVSLDSQP